jgi:prepilin-type processing-associated H-X9-DG protein
MSLFAPQVEASVREETASRKPGVSAWFALLGGGLLLWLLRPSFQTVNAPTQVQQMQSCQANLSRIARAFAQYAQDYNGKFPRGVDPEDRYNPALWTNQYSGGFYRPVAQTAPMLHELLQPYLPEAQAWRCPADNGYERSRLPGFNSSLTHVFPSSYAKYGTSYYYLTIHGFVGVRARDLRNPSLQIILFDGDLWHDADGQPSMNVMYADGHTQNLTARRFQQIHAANERIEE